MSNTTKTKQESCLRGKESRKRETRAMRDERERRDRQDGREIREDYLFE